MNRLVFTSALLLSIQACTSVPARDGGALPDSSAEDSDLDGASEDSALEDRATDADVDASELDQSALEDGATDTSADALSDTGVDPGIDVRTDAGVDTGVDARPDTGVDTGVDARSDTGVDTGVDSGVCVAPLISCGGTCVDPRVSLSHCGGCGRSCSLPNASPACVGGACTIARCADGFGDCDGIASNGCEVDLNRNPSHCSRCGLNCGVNGICASGACMSCASPNSACGSYCANLSNDVRNCGACGYGCARDPRFVASCSNSYCIIGELCDGSARADCNRSAADGYETDISFDSRNCGGCGRTCSSGTLCCLGRCARTMIECPPAC